jgi:hypothetical protein
MTAIIRELRARLSPDDTFSLVEHLARSAEVKTFALTDHMRVRQPIHLVKTTCAKLRRKVGNRSCL